MTVTLPEFTVEQFTKALLTAIGAAISVLLWLSWQQLADLKSEVLRIQASAATANTVMATLSQSLATLSQSVVDNNKRQEEIAQNLHDIARDHESRLRVIERPVARGR